MTNKTKNKISAALIFLLAGIVGIYVLYLNSYTVEDVIDELLSLKTDTNYHHSNVESMYKYDPDLSKLNIDEISKAIERQRDDENFEEQDPTTAIDMTVNVLGRVSKAIERRQNDINFTEQDLVAAFDITANIFDRTMDWHDSVSQESFDKKLAEIFKDLPAQELKKNFIYININDGNDRKFAYHKCPYDKDHEYLKKYQYLYISRKHRLMIPLFTVASIFDYKRLLPDFATADTTYNEAQRYEIMHNIRDIKFVNQYFFGKVDYESKRLDYNIKYMSPDIKTFMAKFYLQFGYDTNVQINEYILEQLAYNSKFGEREKAWDNVFVRLDSAKKMHVRYGMLNYIDNKYDEKGFYLVKQYVENLYENDPFGYANNIKAISLICDKFVPMYNHFKDQTNENWERTNVFYKIMQKDTDFIDSVVQNNYYGSKTLKRVISNTSELAEYIDYPSFVAQEDKYIHKENIAGYGDGLPPQDKFWRGTYYGTIPNCPNFPNNSYSFTITISDNDFNMQIKDDDEYVENFDLSVYDEDEYDSSNDYGRKYCTLALYKINSPETYRMYIFNHTKIFGGMVYENGIYTLEDSEYFDFDANSDTARVFNLLKEWEVVNDSDDNTNIHLEDFELDFFGKENIEDIVVYANFPEDMDLYQDFLRHNFYPREIFLDSMPDVTKTYSKKIKSNGETYKITYSSKNVTQKGHFLNDKGERMDYTSKRNFLTIENSRIISKYQFYKQGVMELKIYKEQDDDE